MPTLRNNIIEAIAKLTRRFHPKGTERILRLFYHPNKRQNDFIETIIPYDKDLKINIRTNSFIEWQIFFKGYYEPTVTNLIKRYLLKGGVFVDIGANIGEHSMVASKIASKVIAIEPSKELTNRIKNNCDLNGITNVTILPLAVSDKEGITPFYESKDCHLGKGSFYGNGNKIDIETKALDEILKNEERVDFIKIDTVGNDGKVILGALKTIEKYHPVIIFEYSIKSWKISGVDLETIELELISRGYTLTRVYKSSDYFNELCLYKPKK